MGVTIHYRLAQRKEHIKNALDVTEAVAKRIRDEQASRLGIEFEVKRESEMKLRIDIGGCETLRFDFNAVAKIIEDAGENWSYDKAVIVDEGLAKLEDEDTYWAAGFCKTQFADNIIEHKWVADLIKVIASRCRIAHVSDEGDYYHSGYLGDAMNAIGENGKLIDNVARMLGGLGFDNVQKGGETKIGKKKLKL
jgi:hypothetical protein